MSLLRKGCEVFAILSTETEVCDGEWGIVTIMET